MNMLFRTENLVWTIKERAKTVEGKELRTGGIFATFAG